MKLINTLLVIIVFAFSSAAQVIYTDIPDETIGQSSHIPGNTETLFIDMDQNQTAELMIAYDGPFSGLFFYQNTQFLPPFIAPKVVGELHPSSARLIDPLDIGFVIDENCGLVASGTGTVYDSEIYITWPQNTDKYIGFKFNLSPTSQQTTHFGWIRVQWDGADLIVKDHAYNSTAGEGIVAGLNSGVGIEDIENQRVLMYPNPVTDVLSIESKRSEINKVHIYDCRGKIVLELINSSRQNSIQLDVTEFEAGLYTILVSGLDWTTRQKLLVN